VFNNYYNEHTARKEILFCDSYLSPATKYRY